MALTNSLAVLLIAVLLQIFLTKLLQQCFLFFIVVVILGHNLGNSQVSVYRTIGPTLGLQIGHPLMRPIWGRNSCSFFSGGGRNTFEYG